MFRTSSTTLTGDFYDPTGTAAWCAARGIAGLCKVPSQNTVDYYVRYTGIRNLSLGMYIANLANNHAFDYGAAGRRSTVRALHAQGIPVTGGRGEIDDMQRQKALRLPVQRYSHGIRQANAFGGVFATDELDTGAVAKIDGRNGDHDCTSRSQACTKLTPAVLLFSG